MAYSGYFRNLLTIACDVSHASKANGGLAAEWAKKTDPTGEGYVRRATSTKQPFHRWLG